MFTSTTGLHQKYKSSLIHMIFTDAGEQVHKMATYFVSGDRKARNPNFDDMPDVDPACSKLFPKISSSGFGYLFLCPVHGHSCGFHPIAGEEGRKDPFASWCKYCAHMPKDIYYDFVCQLSGYCLHREPELFKNTRFWHDLFHFIGHLCGVNFKSGRVLGLEGVHTGICEQVNSFLQFFLCLMNREKTKNYKNRLVLQLLVCCNFGLTGKWFFIHAILCITASKINVSMFVTICSCLLPKWHCIFLGNYALLFGKVMLFSTYIWLLFQGL